MNEIILTHYLRTQVDTRSCPNPECKNVGTIPFNEVVPCSEKFVCDVCNTQWFDHMQKSRTISHLFKTLQLNLYLLLFVEPCPNCHMLL